jgi:hypothetical protein
VDASPFLLVYIINVRVGITWVMHTYKP